MLTIRLGLGVAIACTAPLVAGCDTFSSHKEDMRITDAAVAACEHASADYEAMLEIALRGGRSEHYAERAQVIAETCAASRQVLLEMDPSHPCQGVVAMWENMHWTFQASFEGRQNMQDLAHSVAAPEGVGECSLARGVTAAQLRANEPSPDEVDALNTAIAAADRAAKDADDEATSVRLAAVRAKLQAARDR